MYTGQVLLEPLSSCFSALCSKLISHSLWLLLGRKTLRTSAPESRHRATQSLYGCLSTAKHAIPGFQNLATDFIDLCQVLWSIEAGLKEAAKSRNNLPVEIAQELDKRVRQVHDEFVVLSQMVNKFVDNENHKGGFGRKFRMMYARSGFLTS
jgi:hypothetical protein